MHPPKNKELPLFLAIWRVLQKDLRLEWRSRARVNATIFFALVTLLLFSFSGGPDSSTMAFHASGYLWLAILLSSTLALGESFRVENENGALEGLRLLPVDSMALFCGKALANWILLVALALILWPFSVGLFGVNLLGSLGWGVVVMLLGTGAIAAPGTLYAAIASQAKARDVLLPLLLFPVLVPALVSAVKATALVLHGDPMGQLFAWTALLTMFNLVYWFLGMVLFARVIEE